MAVRYGFFNSINGDRRYDALDMSSIFDGIIEDGVFATIGEFFAVTPGEGLQVIVGTGKAWFDHTWTINDAPLPLEIDPADITLTRVDAVVLEVNNDESIRANSIKIIKGVASSGLQKPTMIETEQTHQHALAYITILGSAVSIRPQDIEIVVGKSDTPFITGPLETVPIDELFSKWNGEFDLWFEDVKTQLGDDVAGNLLNKINSVDEKVDSNWKKTLSEATKKVFDLPSSATPDDAFLRLILGVGKYGYSITVRDQTGSPIEGATINGAKTISGDTAVTDESGTAIVVSDQEMLSFSVTSPYIDILNSTTISVVSTGPMTLHEVTLNDADSVRGVLIKSSRTIKFSKRVSTFDICAVGAGGGGSGPVSTGSFGSGGGGGETVNLLNRSITTIPDKTLQILIGSGCTPYNGSTELHPRAGSTVVSDSSGKAIVTAQGGTASWIQSGGAHLTTPGDGWGVGGSGHPDYRRNGGSSTTYLFDDPSLGLAGGGGGAGFANGYPYDSVYPPGEPYGGTLVGPNYTSDTGRGPGGGASGGLNLATGLKGSDGGVYIRVR